MPQTPAPESRRGTPFVAPAPAKPARQAAEAPFAPPHDFRFQLHATGGFRGLWELTYTPPDGKPVVLIDADNLSSCLDRVSNIFEEAGL